LEGKKKVTIREKKRNEEDRKMNEKERKEEEEEGCGQILFFLFLTIIFHLAKN